MQPSHADGNRVYEVAGILAPDGEHMPLLAPITTEGRPEAWLSLLEASMFSTIRRHLYKVKHTPQRKAVRGWALWWGASWCWL